MSYIERSYEGLSAHCGVKQSPEEVKTFRHALTVFGFLIENNTRISLPQWADRISAYSTSEQAIECARVVRLSM